MTRQYGGFAVTDLTARVAELTALIGQNLDDDEEAAGETARAAPPPWSEDKSSIEDANGRTVIFDEYRWGGSVFAHIARNDPARILRRVKATRDLLAAILAERHDYNDGDTWYSCSQAVEPGEDGEPGSGCANDDRAGKPCDCGRDARVARLLGIIAGEWDEEGA